MQDIDQHLTDLIQRYEGAWSTGYDTFPALVHKLGLRTGAEVGVAFGGHAGAILERGGVDKLFGVDRYQHAQGYDDPMNLTQPVFDRLAQRVVERLAPFGERFELIRTDSEKGAERFEDGVLDFVYLDADHSETGVANDLCHWSAKVREGGIIAGHDYGHRDFPGVKRAVDRYFARFGWPVHELGNGVWYVQRQALNISFFSPCYNCAPYIRSTAMSLINGNMRPGDEYLLVNDGSTDGTINILDALADECPDVRIIEHETNQGGGAARNTAVQNAKHNLLVCLDSDNRMPEGIMDRFRHELLRSDAQVLVPQVIRFFDDADTGKSEGLIESHRQAYPTGRSSFADYLGGRCGGHAPASGGNLLFTRNAYERAGGFPNDSGALDAWGFGLRLAGTDAAIDVVHGTYYWHRCGHDSYWARHAREGTMGLAATELIRPFIHRVYPADQRYMLGQGKDRWYFERDKRTFRIATNDNQYTNKLTLRQGLATLRHRVSPSRIRCGRRDTARLRLVLGLGRSGTSWTHKVLSKCDGELRAYAEPLHHLRPMLKLSDSPDRCATGFFDRFPDRHPLLRAYADLSADNPPTLANPSHVLLRGAPSPTHIVIKEVHALLATPALFNALDGKAVVITRDPMRVVDSIFDCQGLASPYLHHELAACSDSRMLAYIGTPAQSTRRLAIWHRIQQQENPAKRRALGAIWAAAITQRVMLQTAEQLPDRVMTIAYEQATNDPRGVFAEAAAHLDLDFGSDARAFCHQTQSRDESQDPYSVFRRGGTTRWRVLTDELRATATDLLQEGELTTPHTVALKTLNHAPIKKSA